jgi:hypothetical protein
VGCRRRARTRAAIGPDAFLERAWQLGLVRLLDEVVALVVERGVEEEPVVLDLEVAVLLADSALAEREQLLALGKRPHRDGPFFESDWHSEGKRSRGCAVKRTRAGGDSMKIDSQVNPCFPLSNRIHGLCRGIRQHKLCGRDTCDLSHGAGAPAMATQRLRTKRWTNSSRW